MDPPPLPSHPLLKSQTIFLPLRPSCRSPLTISSPSKGSVSRFNLHPLGLIYNPDLSQEQRMLYSSTSNLPHEAVLKPPQFSISASELYGYNRTVFADMSFNDNTVQYATTHNPAPSRRRRSQPSLESHPYLTTGQRSPISMHHGDTHGYAHDGTMIKSESQSPAYYASPTSYQMGIPSIPQQSAYFHHYDTTQVQAPYHQMRISLPQHAMTGFLQLFMPLAQDPAMYSQECLPTEGDFDKLLNQYITSLSPKKRDKALIPMKRCENIRAVLLDPKCTTIESAQFRFWAKKMFKLGEVHGFSNTVLHDNKPVAVREDLYHILSQSHLHAQHGGRDKTSGQVRKYYSW